MSCNLWQTPFRSIRATTLAQKLTALPRLVSERFKGCYQSPWIIETGHAGWQMLMMSERGIGGRRVLVVERENSYAASMGEVIEARGGNVVARVTSGIDAVSFVRLSQVDLVFVHTRTLEQIPFPLDVVMASFGVPTVVVTSCDDWFEEDAHLYPLEDEPLVEMPRIVVHSKKGADRRAELRLMTISARRPW